MCMETLTPHTLTLRATLTLNRADAMIDVVPAQCHPGPDADPTRSSDDVSSLQVGAHVVCEPYLDCHPCAAALSCARAHVAVCHTTGNSAPDRAVRATCRMKADAAAKNLPPVYRGKWASASEQEVQEARDAGLECCYRYRVPKVRPRWSPLILDAQP